MASILTGKSRESTMPVNQSESSTIVFNVVEENLTLVTQRVCAI